jgi:O-antigen/teichoic acid export membrane protein
MVLSLSLNILFLSVFHLGVWAILWSILITKAVNLTVVPICLRGDSLRFSWEKLRPMLRYALPLLPASLSMFFLHFGDRFFLQRYCSLTDVGIYSLGYKFGMIVATLVAAPFQRVWGTHSFEIERQPDAKLVYARVFTYFATLLAFGSLCICVFIRDVIGIMAPPNYAAAASIVPMVALAYILYALNNAAGLGIMIRNKTKNIAFIQIPVVALNAILNFALIPSYGILGAALATLISFGIMFLLTFAVSQRLYPIAYEYRRLTILAGTTLALFLLSKLAAGPWLWPVLFHCTIVIALPLLLLALRFFTRDEIEAARPYFRRIAPWLSRTAA